MRVVLFVHASGSGRDPKIEDRAVRIVTEAFATTISTEVRVYDASTSQLSADLVVFIGDELGAAARSFCSAKRVKTYLIDSMGRLVPLQPLDETDYPHLSTHIFNQLSPHDAKTSYFFPYGFLFRHTGLGPLNEFGHRIATPLRELCGRPKEHKVVAVFGGSAAASFYCLHSEMFSTVLQDRLNRWSGQIGNGLKFTVLNFAQPSGVVLNEMFHFLLFCRELRPDVVIAHDGFNDLGFGMISDTYLLNEFNLTYQNNLEEWSQILHGERAGVTPASVTIRNIPDRIIRAYLTRKAQFKEVVEAAGGTFISGFQPFIHSKQSLSAAESEYLERVARVHEFAPVYSKMPFLYDECEKYLKGVAASGDSIDLHTVFSKYDSSATHFVDYMHTTPLGEAIIAEQYEEVLRQQFSTGGGR